MILSDSEIQSLTERWKCKKELVKDVISILVGDREPLDGEIIVNRIRKANSLLEQASFPPVTKEKKVEIRIGNGQSKEAIYIPGIDLRCAPIGIRSDLSGIVLTGAHLEGIHFEASKLDYAHFESANLERIQIHDSTALYADFRKADLSAAVFNNTSIKHAILRKTNLSGAHIVRCKLEGSNFAFAKIGVANFIGEKQEMINVNGKIVHRKENWHTTFVSCSYLPLWRDHLITKQYIYNLDKLVNGDFEHVQKVRRILEIKWSELKKHFQDRWNFTNFEHVRIEAADTLLARDLYRYIHDQQYLASFRLSHPWIYKFWKILSDCGGRISWVFMWSIIFILLFAGLYAALPLPIIPGFEPLTPDVLIAKEPPINPNPIFEKHENYENLSPTIKWIYVSFDIFSNLGIRLTYPNNALGVILIITESLLGFMMLGMLISVLANRFARRS